jgi:class 3 adenylate cyclase/tetratricopeptide (TPR) repeat protein
MRCHKCSAENREEAKFCAQCATFLRRLCQKCGGENPPEARFCADCASPLDDRAPPRTEAETSETLTGERRHLTVLFCDLVGSTAIAAQLDPEEWRETVAGYHRAAAEVITRVGGYVAKYLGDGVMAFFGHPEAHDNDAERAVRAGLAIITAIVKLNGQPAHAMLSARIGIDSGAVVVGASAGGRIDVFGEAPNIAARVQASAAPDTVVITANTHRLVSGLFVVEELGAQPLKGAEGPVQLYRVIQPGGVRGRLGAAAAAGGLTPFVGREDELRTLMNRWERALDGEGQVVLIVGEPGIGKSRLLQRFHAEIEDTPHTWVEAMAGPFFQNTPFYPVADLLQQFLGGNGDKSPDERLAQLEPRLALAGLKPAEAIPLIAPLLNLPLPAKYSPLPLSPEQQRRRLLATLVEWVLGAARAQPLVIATEDLHWADPSTLELIELLVNQGATARLLLLYTARPEFRAQWPLRAHHTQITLNRLSAGNSRSMVGEVAAQKALSEEIIAMVVERTSGVPLFVEELTRAVLESGDAMSKGQEIPVTLHDSLMARLDRLGRGKEVIQVGAVIGGEFSYELLHAIHPIAEEDLEQSLSNLADAELVYVRGLPPNATYQFKHALIRDAAYEALLRTRRRELHRKIAQTINDNFADLAEARPGILARHWTEAGEVGPAIAAWSKAGEAAEARSAFREAQESYQQALAQLNLLVESPERDLRELELRQAIVRMLFITRGYSAPEVIEAAERAATLAENSGNLRQFINLLITRGLSSVIGGQLRAAVMLADQALELALRYGSPSGLGRAQMLQTMARYYRGDFAGAEEHFTAGSQFFDHPNFRRVPGAAVAAFTYSSWNAWMLGRTSGARERIGQMMAVANRNNPHDLAVSDFHAAVLQILMGEYEQAEALAARALELSEKHRFFYQAAFSRCVLGSARAQLGRATEGIALIRRGIAGSFELGAHIAMIYWMASLAEAEAREGAVDDALETLEQALQANPDELAWRPQILRIRGELRLNQGLTRLAEADLREAIALAQTMSGTAWELRATTSLARLLASHGRRDEARTMVADIYGWFTEGFDTTDMKDAKALLDELAR